MSEPLIVGIRHHSPACARLVKSLIESQRPRGNDSNLLIVFYVQRAFTDKQQIKRKAQSFD